MQGAHVLRNGFYPSSKIATFCLLLKELRSSLLVELCLVNATPKLGEKALRSLLSEVVCRRRFPRIYEAISLLSVVSLHTSSKLLHRYLGISQQHVGVFLEKNRVVDTSVTRRQTPLHHNHLLGIPNTQDRHTSDLRIWIVFGGRIHGIVG